MKKYILIIFSSLLFFNSYSMFTFTVHFGGEGVNIPGQFWGFGGCTPGGIVCFSPISNGGSDESDDYGEFNVKTLTLQVKVSKDNHPEAEKYIIDNNLSFKNDSGLSLDLMRTLEVNDGKFYAIIKGDYKVKSDENYYYFTLKTKIVK